MKKYYPPILPRAEKGETMGVQRQIGAGPKAAVIYVDDESRAVRAGSVDAARAACAEVLRAATPPAVCSREVPVAPARGPMQAFRPMVAVITRSGPRLAYDAPAHEQPAKVASALDLISLRSRSRQSGPIFTVGHHQAAAAYEALFERVNAGRVKCSDWQATGGQSAGCFMDAVISDIQRLGRMDAAIQGARWSAERGHEPILSPAIPDGCGRPAKPIYSMDVVHWAIVRRDPLSSLLLRHGMAKQTRHLEKLRSGLMEALEAIQGL